MKRFKKIIAITLLIAVSVSSVFAATAFTPETDAAYKLVANPYRKTSARMPAIA